MANYVLEEEAENDLLEIGRYTARTWSLKQAESYLTTLLHHFDALGQGRISGRVVLEEPEEVLYSRCRHHRVFYVMDRGRGAIILAVLHEQMDLMTRLRERLDGRSQ